MSTLIMMVGRQSYTRCALWLLASCAACGTTELPERPRDAGHAQDAAPVLDAAADASIVVDPGPPNAGFACITEWPDYIPPSTPSASLNGPRLALLRVDARGRGLEGNGSLWGGRLAATGGNILWSYNVAADTWSKSNLAASTCQEISPPAPRPDAPGGFAFGCLGVLALRPDFEPGPSLGDQGIVWVRLLNTNQSPYHETTSVSPMVVHPGGTMYLTATDGWMRAINAVNGVSVWERPLPLDAFGYRKDPSFGIGDRIFVGGTGYDRRTGAPFAVPRVNDKDVQIVVPAYGHRLIGVHGAVDVTNRRMVVLDECGNHVWTLPKLASYGLLVGFDDQILLNADTGRGSAKAYVYSRDGEMLAGPGEAFTYALALGADGVAYYGNCVPAPGGNEALEVVAVSPTLEVLARVNVGISCFTGGAVLMDDGRLLIPRLAGGDLQVVHMATSSPGLAKTAWPTRFHDNARTGWVSAW